MNCSNMRTNLPGVLIRKLNSERVRLQCLTNASEVPRRTQAQIVLFLSFELDDCI